MSTYVFLTEFPLPGVSTLETLALPIQSGKIFYFGGPTCHRRNSHTERFVGRNHTTRFVQPKDSRQ